MQMEITKDTVTPLTLLKILKKVEMLSKGDFIEVKADCANSIDKVVKVLRSYDLSIELKQMGDSFFLKIKK